ncbi:hypothetical protein EMCRGX_G026256 [Ephydatia muelleri]
MPKRRAEQVEESADGSLDSPEEQGKTPHLRKRRAVEEAVDETFDPLDQLPVEATKILDDSLDSSAKKRKSLAPTPTVPKKKSAKTVQEGQQQENELFEALVSGGSALQPVVSEWVKRYEDNAEAAVVELIQLFVVCCGCKATITMEMYRKSETSEAIRSLTENFAEESGDYPLVTTGPIYKKFKVTFVEFVEKLIEQCQHAAIYDEYLLDTLIMWLVALTDSQVRAFRHTCTLACVKLVTALITVAHTVNAELDNTQRQIDSEEKRPDSRRGAGKLEKLAEKRQELQRHINSLHEIMDFIFSSVFVRRYRDICADVRAICLAELGVWMKGYSAHFLADSYLKYIGWTLYDKTGDVRLASLVALQGLYSSEELVVHLDMFTQRFKARMTMMRLDKEEAVAVHAIQLCATMMARDMLEAEECVEICELVFLESRTQARVVKGRKKPTEHQIMLMELVRFYVDVKIHEHATYFVDSLWEYTDVLRDWEAMSSMLLDDKCGVVLNDEEESVLIEIITCAAKRATSTAIPTGRARGRVLSSKERRAMEEEKEQLSTVLMSAIPALMSKYGTDANKATNLASIPQHFNLDLYSEHRLHKQLEVLLNDLKELMMKHTDPGVLDECALTYQCLSQEQFSLHSTTDVALSQLVDDLVQNMKQYVSACKDDSLEDNEDLFGLAVTLRRLVALYSVIDLSRWKFTDDLILVLDIAVAEGCIDKVLCNVLMCLRLEAMWTLHSLDVNSPQADTVKWLKARLQHLVEQCLELVKFGSALGQLGPLVYMPDDNMQHALQMYVQQSVFSGLEDEKEPDNDEEALAQAELLNDRRVLLAGFLKLAIYGIIDMKHAAPVFSQYVKQFHNFGDLIKMAVTKCRESNPISWYKTVVLSLQQVYEQTRNAQNGAIDHTSAEWVGLRDLARRYSLTLGLDWGKVRQPVVGIHRYIGDDQLVLCDMHLVRDGMIYALACPNGDEDDAPPHLDFLEVVSEFSYHLIDVDRKGLVAFLQSQLTEGTVERIEKHPAWKWLMAFKKTLVDPEHAKGSKGRPKGTPGRPRGRPRAPSPAEEEGPPPPPPPQVAKEDQNSPGSTEEQGEVITPPDTGKKRGRGRPRKPKT